MTLETPQHIEESLDPDDWPALRALGHQMLDDMLDYLETVRSRPVWQPIPDDIRSEFNDPLPLEPQNLEQVYQTFQRYILPYQLGNTHPRFWGWVIGTGTPVGMLAEMLAAAVNPNVWGANQIACDVEMQVLNWLKEALLFPPTASGLLVSGCSMANLIGLSVARNLRSEFDVRQQGMSAAPTTLRIYASAEGHSSIQRAAELLGLGNAGLRRIPVNARYQIDVRSLEEAITDDLDQGFQPLCVVGCAGTVNTGAVDDLYALANVCEQYGLWFHVDGAFGALTILSPQLRSPMRGIERADSLAFDLHKWLSMPYDVGCILVRREEDHRRAFTLTPDYLAQADRGLAAATFAPNDYGPELSRGFRALKVWMSLRTHGILKYGRLIQQNVDQAKHLSTLIQEESRLELLVPVQLNIVCFRYRAELAAAEVLDRLNREILIRLQEEGIAAPSHTLIGGRYALRVAITNHRSQREDFATLVKEVVRIGNDLARRSHDAG